MLASSSWAATISETLGSGSSPAAAGPVGPRGRERAPRAAPDSRGACRRAGRPRPRRRSARTVTRRAPRRAPGSARRRASQEYGPAAAASRGGGEALARSGRRRAARPARSASASGSPGGTSAPGAVRRDLGEAADVAHHDRLAERERRVQDARLLGVAVREHDEVGAAEVRGQLAVGDEAGHEAHRPGARAASSRSGPATSRAGRPTTQSSAPSTERNASSSTSTPL